MKKLIMIFCLICILAGCTSNTVSLEDRIFLSLEKYYGKTELYNNGTLIINQIKEFENGYLVMAEKHSGDGHSFDVLFLMDDKLNVTGRTAGTKPMSPCFSYNKLYYNGKTILFGSFNDTKWVPEIDEKVTVDIKEIYIELKNKETIREKVNADKGYLIIFDGDWQIEKFELYDNNQSLQAHLDETVAINDELTF